jgi:hypothetical protein
MFTVPAATCVSKARATKAQLQLDQHPAYADATLIHHPIRWLAFYWVTAVNRAGKESGPSPYAMTSGCAAGRQH